MGVRLGTHLDRADVVGTNDAIRHHDIISSLQFSLLNLLYQVAEMIALDSMMRSVVPMFNNLADDKSGPKFDGISRLIRNWDFYLRRRRIAERDGIYMSDAESGKCILAPSKRLRNELAPLGRSSACTVTNEREFGGSVNLSNTRTQFTFPKYCTYSCLYR